MPYEARKGDGESWIVVNKDTNETKATHEPPEAEEKAQRQVKLLNAIEHDAAWSQGETGND